MVELDPSKWPLWFHLAYVVWTMFVFVIGLTCIVENIGRWASRHMPGRDDPWGDNDG